MEILRPYLLYLGQTADPLAVKTARGIAVWRPEACIGQYRRNKDAVGLGLQDMSFAEAVGAGARTMVIGVANAGGVMGADIVEDVLSALQAGLDVASGLHQRLGEHPEIRQTARSLGRRIVDVREPPGDLPVGTGWTDRGAVCSPWERIVPSARCTPPWRFIGRSSVVALQRISGRRARPVS